VLDFRGVSEVTREEGWEAAVCCSWTQRLESGQSGNLAEHQLSSGTASDISPTMISQHIQLAQGTYYRRS